MPPKLYVSSLSKSKPMEVVKDTATDTPAPKEKKARKPLSEEQKQKMKEAREAKKAEKETKAKEEADAQAKAEKKALAAQKRKEKREQKALEQKQVEEPKQEVTPAPSEETTPKPKRVRKPKEPVAPKKKVKVEEAPEYVKSYTMETLNEAADASDYSKKELKQKAKEIANQAWNNPQKRQVLQSSVTKSRSDMFSQIFGDRL